MAGRTKSWDDWEWVKDVIAEKCGYVGPLTPGSCPLEDWLNPVQAIGAEFSRVKHSKDPRAMDVLIEALDNTLREYGFKVELREDE